MDGAKDCEGIGYFHLCSPGEEGKNFIKTRDDHFAAFNLVGVCAAEYENEVFVLSFSIEDSHPHLLLRGTRRGCELFASRYSKKYSRHIVSSRGNSDGVVINIDVIPVTDEEYLMRTGAYTIIQPTKDGKKVMPYDFLFGTGSMYFRSLRHIPIWLVSESGEVLKPQRIGELSRKQRNKLLFCKKESVPDDWLICQGFLLPSNYVRVDLFENIYKTHNCFRAFCSLTNRQLQEMLARTAEYRGITMDDFEARTVCGQACRQLFGTADTRRLDCRQRLTLAQRMRREYHLSFRQLSTLVHLPEIEIKSYC